MPRRSFDIPIPARGENPDGYSTKTILLAEDLLVTSWVDGITAVRVGILRLTDGSWRVIKGVRGMLRAAAALPGNRVLLLTDFGLFEVDHSALEVTRKLTAKIGRHNTSIQHIADGVIAVGHDVKSMDTLVSLSTLDPVGRQRRPFATPALVHAEAARAGVVRVLDARHGLTVGATSPYPGAHSQRMLVFDADYRLVLDEAMPWGVDCALIWGGGIIAAPLRLAEHVPLRAFPTIPGCPAVSPRDLADLETSLSILRSD